MYKHMIVIVLVFLLGLSTASAESYEGIIIYEYTNELSYKIFDIQLEQNEVKEKVVKLFTLLTTMDYNDNQIKLIPSESKIQYVEFYDGNLVIKFNDKILNYGGNTHEYYLINQLLFSFFSIEEVENISLLIDDRGNLFSEGTQIINYSREDFLERMLIDES